MASNCKLTRHVYLQSSFTQEIRRHTTSSSAKFNSTFHHDELVHQHSAPHCLTFAEVHVAILSPGVGGRLNGKEYLLADQFLPEELPAGPGAGLVSGGLSVARPPARRPRGRHVAEVQLTLLGPACARLTPDCNRIAGENLVAS